MWYLITQHACSNRQAQSRPTDLFLQGGRKPARQGSKARQWSGQHAAAIMTATSIRWCTPIHTHLSLELSKLWQATTFLVWLCMIFAVRFTAYRRPTAADVSILHPLQPTSWPWEAKSKNTCPSFYRSQNQKFRGGGGGGLRGGEGEESLLGFPL